MCHTIITCILIYFKVILYSYLILKKMNERIKTKYIPSYIFENEDFFKKRKLPKLNEFPENLRQCSAQLLKRRGHGPIGNQK